MIKVLIIVNQNNDSTFFRSVLKREIERETGFNVIALTTSIDDGLMIASKSYPDIMILSASEDDKEFREQIESVVRFRSMNIENFLNNIMIISCTNYEYAARRLSDADMLYQFVRPMDPYELTNKLCRLYPVRQKQFRFEEDKKSFVMAIKELLIRFDIYPSYLGYKYIVDAATELKFSKRAMLLTKDIYPIIGARYGRSGLSVERAIRLVSRVAWNSSEWKICFPNMSKTLSNLEFISLLTEYAEAI